jgi:hypothetical protein
VFVVVTLFVALGIAAAQGCQGPPRGLGDDRDVVRQQEQANPPRDYEPLKGPPMSQRYESTFSRED